MRIKSDLIYIIETIRYSVLEVAAAAAHIAQIKDRTSPGLWAAGAGCRCGDLSCRGSYQAVNSLRMDTSSSRAISARPSHCPPHLDSSGATAPCRRG